jgi:DNA-binding SARP family transcriptional activator
VECAGRVVPIGAAKERLIVVLLALNIGRVVPIDRLVDATWADEPPKSANTTVRVLVSRLRKTLAAAGCREVIDTRPPGYLMAADSVDVDVQRFQALADRGRARLAAGSAPEAAAILRAALDIWRGDRLAEADNPRLAGEAARLAEARLSTLQARVDADLACGRHLDLIGELDELCHNHRLREPLWAQRMLALYRCGRQADALAAYQQLRITLADELGLDPGSDVRKLQAAILAQDPTLVQPPAERPAARPPPASLPADIPVPLPAPLRVSETVACLGRDLQLGELRAAWERALTGEPRMVFVAGEAGVGKTRLVREFARKHAPTGRGGAARALR